MPSSMIESKNTQYSGALGPRAARNPFPYLMTAPLASAKLPFKPSSLTTRLKVKSHCNHRNHCCLSAGIAAQHQQVKESWTIGEQLTSFAPYQEQHPGTWPGMNGNAPVL
eukprot:1153218-Pelagomonas_calceolata.AAC.2